MKKTLIIAILALSINAFAQNNLPASWQHHPTFNKTENKHCSLGHEGLQLPDLFSRKYSGQSMKHQVLKQNTIIQLIDSIYIWEWDTLNIGWKILSEKINKFYDANNNLKSQLWQLWNGDNWSNREFTYTYDANNNLISEFTQYWNGTIWENHLLNTNTYDANNNLTSRKEQPWNGTAWDNVYQSSYTYDDNNNLTIELLQSHYNNFWENFTQHTATYDSNNNLITKLLQFWEGNIWENSQLNTNTYDANNNLISELFQTWNGSLWVNSTRNSSTYDANNNLTSRLSQMWNNSAWDNHTQHNATYDTNNNLTSELYQSAWANPIRIFSTYDANNNLTSRFGEQWNDISWVKTYEFKNTFDVNNFTESEVSKLFEDNGTVYMGDSTYYYFHTVVTGVKEMKSQDENITVYPNPSSGKFKISSSNTMGSIEIFDLAGRRIYSKSKLDNQTSADVDLLPYGKGIYIVKIENGSNYYSKKIIVQ